MNITSKNVDGKILVLINEVEIGEIISVKKDFVIIHGDYITWKIKYNHIN